MHDPDPVEEFDDDPIGSMRKAAAHFEQNPVMYTHPISKKTKAIARIGLRAVFFLPARERQEQIFADSLEAIKSRWLNSTGVCCFKPVCFRVWGIMAIPAHYPPIKPWPVL